MAKAHRTSSDYSSIDDLSLPRGATAAFYKDQNGPLVERSNSDSNLDLQSPQSWSSLSVDKSFFCLKGVGKTHDAKVRVEWDIKENVGAQDWIGLFHAGETDNSKFLDCKTRGSSGGAAGAIIWDLDAVEHLFSEAETAICFKYISGNSGDVLASSSLVLVTLAKNDELSPSQVSNTSANSMENALFSIKIEELRATNLKKGMFFNPDPYVKIQVLPHNQRNKTQKHHYHEHRSSVVTNTANPSWELEKFSMEVLPSDLMEIEVKHKFSKSRPTMSRFLGRTTIPVQTIMERIASEQKPAHFSLELMRKGPSDNVSGVIAFKASLHLVLQNNESLDLHKPNNGLQRQISLPNSLPRIDENTPRSSRIRHRHTDPGMNVAEVLNMHVQVAGIREEAETVSPSSSVRENKNKNATVSRPIADNKQHTYDSGTFLEITHEQTDACTTGGTGMQPNLETQIESLEIGSDVYQGSGSGLPPTSETFMDSSDSGTSLSVVSSTENSGGSIPSSLVPPIREVAEPVAGISSPPNSTVPNLVKQCDNNGSKTSIADVPNGQIASGGCVKDSSNQGLDMSVQSAGLYFPTSNSVSDAPILPPRTYKGIAPPLPPRVFPSQAPPIPPRDGIGRKKRPPGPSLPISADNTRATLEPPPPLPPRTYSPVEVMGDVSETEHHHGISHSSDRELFPWASPTTPSSSNTAHSQSPQSLSPTSHSLTSHHSPSSNSRQTQHTSEHLALVPLMENAPTSSQPGHASHHMLPRRCVDGVPGSRGSVALSTVSEPAGSSLSSLQTDPSHLKRRSIDGLPQLNTSIAPLIHPRQHRLSNEERQQINENLEQWTRKRQGNNLPGSSPGDQSSPPSFTECEQMEADECLSPILPPPPPLPPSVSPAGGTNLRSTDSVDGQATSSHSPGHRNIAQPQVPTSSPNGPVPGPSSSTTRERSGDRKPQGADSGDQPRLPSKRPTKYHRVDDRDDALPSGWEARVDSHGRIFYIDHVNRTTTWQRPQTGLQTVQRRPTLSSEQRQQLDRRYQSIRRTINQSQLTDTENVSSGESRDTSSGASNVADNSPSSSSPSDRASERSERSVYKFPAVKFLTRPDFFPMLQANENAMVDYNRNSKLKHMITKIRRDPKTFERYHHNRDLVSFVNLFSDPSKELHRRWEMKYDRSGKAFFIDHVLRTTTFMDPRLPTDVPLINTDFLPPPAPRPRRNQEASQLDLPVPPPRDPIPENTAAIPTAYNEKVVLFLRQPNVDDILRERSPQYASSSSLREKVNKIAARGVDMLERFSNDIELTLLLSLFENEIMSYVPRSTVPSTSQVSPAQRLARVPAPYKRDFQAKLRNFYRKLESKGYGQGPGKLKLTVRRDHVLEDAFNKIMSTPKKELQKNKLYITFAGEEGLDYGGPSREFFFLLSRELFNPYYGLFEYSANDTYTVQVSPLSTFVENAHEWFRFSGRVLGLALVHQYLLDAFFTRPFYKALLGVPLSLEDVESLDMEFHQSLLWIKDNDISENDLDLTFSVSEEVFGQITERELKPNGKNISVTERNKKEYIEKMVISRLERGVTEQTKSLIGGFHEVLDARLVSTFDARELELVIAGTVEIDIGDWRRNTDYRSGYHDQHPVIQWFWEAIEKFDNERQLRLLQFVTGSSSIPYEGFSALRGSNGPRKFCIEKWGKITSLPRAHTCFNRLDLPPYTSSEMLFEKLVMAVEETSTFGID